MTRSELAHKFVANNNNQSWPCYGIACCDCPAGSICETSWNAFPNARQLMLNWASHHLYDVIHLDLMAETLRPIIDPPLKSNDPQDIS